MKKSEKSTSYCETMSENFQQLKKTMKKMTKLIIKCLKSHSSRSQSDTIDETTKNRQRQRKIVNKKCKRTKKLEFDSKKTSETARKSQSTKKA
jgi:uncharacterized membrane protein YgaE (UPF0421/DUF939 family)